MQSHQYVRCSDLMILCGRRRQFEPNFVVGVINYATLVVAGAQLRLKKSHAATSSRWAAKSSAAKPSWRRTPRQQPAVLQYRTCMENRLDRQRCLRLSEQGIRVSRWGTIMGRSMRSSTCHWVKVTLAPFATPLTFRSQNDRKRRLPPSRPSPSPAILISSTVETFSTKSTSDVPSLPLAWPSWA